MPLEGANPAQERLKKARARLWKLIAGAAAGGYLAGALLITLGVLIGSAEVELSEPESYSVHNESAVINVADISDGHLHRFAYTTSSGVEVRFIVIQKAGSSFGVGLDACEICGASGYYEKDGKIICKLCEVAMNIATIGFKGGCNPIPIEYEVSNGTLSVPLSVLEANADSHEYGSLGGKVSGYQHIVGYAMCHLAYRRGCGRSYQHSIRPETEIHMAVPCTIPSGEKFADDRLGSQSREGDGSNELLAGRSNDYLHFSLLFDEQAGQNGSLVGCDTPRDTEDDVLTGQR